MRFPSTWFCLTILISLESIRMVSAQTPSGEGAKPPPEEYKYIVHDLTEAYKAPHEVDEDVLDELRKQYRDPNPKRETKILYEIRRLYPTTPEHEEAILREIRATYANPTPEQENRVFAVIRQNGRLPAGTIPAAAINSQTARLFSKLDRDKSGGLVAEELPENLRLAARQWDQNADGLINSEEYAAYYRDQLSQVSAKVASGEITLKLPKGMALPKPESATTSKPVDERPVIAMRFGKLPPGLPTWFRDLDEDQDGQIGLYEWRKARRATAEFVLMDQNGDGLLPPDEYLRFLKSVPMEPPVASVKPEAKSSKPTRGM